jgi:hypothetical protein
MRISRLFWALPVARSFVDGIEYVNDSSIRDVTVVYVEAKDKWEVSFEDCDVDRVEVERDDVTNTEDL